MQTETIIATGRRPRFRRASEPPAFRLTDDDIEIVRLLARHRFLRSTHIAALIGRSLDAVNGRLNGLFHHGYIDRPRAQLDYYPTAGSAPIAYALADRGARLLKRDGTTFANLEWSRKNREAGRPFIEHQLEIMDFYVALQIAMRDHNDARLVHADEMIATLPDRSSASFNLRVKLHGTGAVHEIGVVPDLVFGIRLASGAQYNFMVEIDRGTMPIVRSDIRQTSFARKMHAYLAAHAARKHERHFAWKTFRVLTITTDDKRMQTMMNALRRLRVARSPGAQLFYFATRYDLRAIDPLTMRWCDGNGYDTRLIE
jgi:DNA-binding Lrp family transcriptional regulator